MSDRRDPVGQVVDDAYSAGHRDAYADLAKRAANPVVLEQVALVLCPLAHRWPYSYPAAKRWPCAWHTRKAAEALAAFADAVEGSRTP